MNQASANKRTGTDTVPCHQYCTICEITHSLGDTTINCLAADPTKEAAEERKTWFSKHHVNKRFWTAYMSVTNLLTEAVLTAALNNSSLADTEGIPTFRIRTLMQGALQISKVRSSGYQKILQTERFRSVPDENIVADDKRQVLLACKRVARDFRKAADELEANPPHF